MLVWRISCPPTSGRRSWRASAAQPFAKAFYDWSGGLIWLALPASDDADHASCAARGATGGHAT